MKVPLCLLALAPGLLAADFPLPQTLIAPEKAGLGIQRTMQLLASSTPEKRNTVRILYYGQSITEQGWTKQVTQYLKSTYPNANLIIENRAIGGHVSQMLVKTAEADLYPFQPDLLIFHVYGAHDKYEEIIRTVREKTCAEVILQTDHLSADHKLDEESDPSKLTPGQWTPWFNYSFLPSLADKYQVEVIPQRDLWKQYLRDNQLQPPALLKDGVHLNPQGEFLMAEIVESDLKVRPGVSPIAVKRVVTKPLSGWKAGQDSGELELTVPFEGNRIDAVLANEGAAATVDVLIDGKAPSTFPTTFAFSRVSNYYQSGWPVVLRIVLGPAPLVPEDWTILLKDPSEDYTHFRFSLSGSVTGPDGEGSGTEKFVSKSGRIEIDPEDWDLVTCLKVFKHEHPVEEPITFKTIPLHLDSFQANPNPDKTTEATLTLAQNLPAGPHVLTLRARGQAAPPVAAVRSYDPSAR